MIVSVWKRGGGGDTYRCTVFLLHQRRLARGRGQREREAKGSKKGGGGDAERERERENIDRTRRRNWAGRRLKCRSVLVGMCI